MSIAILLTSTNDAVELIFDEPFVVGQYREFLVFWRERSYRQKNIHGFIPEGMLLARVLEIPSDKTFDASVAEVMGPLDKLESGNWRGLAGVWKYVDEGLGPCISLFLQVASQVALQLEYSIDPADSTPWSPFAEDSLLARIVQVSVVAPPHQIP